VSDDERSPGPQPLKVSIPTLRDKALLDFLRSLDPGTLKIKLPPRRTR
jgi:hypothetical protein